MHLTADIATIGGPIAGSVLLVFFALRKIIPWLRRVGHFLDDWGGEPARPGVPEKPGVMVRLGTLEQRTAAIEQQMSPNGGTSIYDKVTRVDNAVATEGAT